MNLSFELSKDIRNNGTVGYLNARHSG